MQKIMMVDLVLGLQEVGAADAQFRGDLFCELSDKVCKTTSDDGDSKFNKAFALMKNLIGDRYVTQKKFNNLSVEYLTKEQQKKCEC